MSYRHCINNTLQYLFKMISQFCGLSKLDPEWVVYGFKQLWMLNLCVIVMYEINK